MILLIILMYVQDSRADLELRRQFPIAWEEQIPAAPQEEIVLQAPQDDQKLEDLDAPEVHEPKQIRHARKHAHGLAPRAQASKRDPANVNVLETGKRRSQGHSKHRRRASLSESEVTHGS